MRPPTGGRTRAGSVGPVERTASVGIDHDDLEATQFEGAPTVHGPADDARPGAGGKAGASGARSRCATERKQTQLARLLRGATQNVRG